MHDVKHMLESVLGLLGRKREFAQQLGLNNRVRLGDDQVVPVWELVEGVLQEVF